MAWRAALAALLLMLLAAPAAHGEVLYSTLQLANDVQGRNADFATNTTWVAQAFTLPKKSTPRLAAFYAQANIDDTASVTMSIYGNNAGKPGAELVKTSAETVGDETGAAPTCALFPQPVELEAGTYWAVFKADSGGASWLFWNNAQRNSERTINSGGLWTTQTDGKIFGLRIEDTACAPDVKPNPDPGTSAGTFAQRPGTVDDATVTLQNEGTRPLVVTGASFTGTGASVFKVRQGEPGGPMDIPFTWPKTIGATASAVLIMHVDCAPATTTPDGLYKATFTVTTNDPDEPSISWPVECIVDGTPPFIVLTLGFPGGRDDWFLTLPSIYLDGSDTGVGLKEIFCEDSAGPTLSGGIGAPVTLTLTQDGDHQLDCRAADWLGNTIAAGTHPVHYKVDTTAPNATKKSGPGSFTNITTPTFEWTETDATSGVEEVECSVDGGAYAACETPETVSALVDGNHTFEVRLTDVAGNVDATPAKWQFLLDTVAPTTTIVAGPPALTTETTAYVTAGVADTGGSGVGALECSIDGGTWNLCPPMATYALLGEGTHTARVRARDRAGNTDPTPAEHTWSIDLTAPTAAFLSKPAVLTASQSATFTFEGADAGPSPAASFACRLDDAEEFTPCASPVTYDDLAMESIHTLAVIATDTLGNVQATATTYTWEVSGTPRATADRFTTTAGVAADLDVAANDLNPIAGALTPVLAGTASAKGGAVSVAGAKVRYVPPAGFTGTDTFTYRAVNSADRLSGAATVTVVVAPKPAGPSLLPPPPALDRTTPVVSDVKVKKRKLRFVLTEAATATIVVKERVKGRRKPVKRGTLTVAGTAGRNVVRGSRRMLKPGRRYVITVIAVDAAGNASARVKVKPRIP